MTHQIRWTQQKIAQRLKLIEPFVYRERHPLPPFFYTSRPSPEVAPLLDGPIDAQEWTQIPPHSYWGNWQTNFMLRGSFEVPTTWDPSLPVALSLPLGDAGDYFPHPEALLYIDGTAYAACDRNHQEILLSDIYRSGHSHSLALHGWTGLGCGTGQPSTQLYMRPCEVVQIDQPTRDFIATARVALGSAEVLSESSPARAKILHALNEAFIALDTYEPGSPSFYASTTQAHALLRSALAQAGPPLAVDITATGHAHIDVAWLWTLGQARRKAGRTFHTVARLMEQFPDYHFTQSQPQLYDYIRHDHPTLFETIKQRVSIPRHMSIDARGQSK
ncbi:hypothetical protein [Ktedonobacter robiniae]|uniref:Glycoside hydrolase family 38 N-terminal domain-containing protein n=1 Tax=Ktedonobacter robiniae TaxID=2778365 RepID=A0ABQ3V7Y6_9CHLR|nr:hypothetical protein [Ktedonobacter robiniae]GHO61023.1 hypothetical protein KSB_94980 [Ktedonobacter robiniae]